MEVLPPIQLSAYLYAAPQHLVMPLTLRCGAMGRFWPYRSGAMQDPANELRRIPLPRTRVNRAIRRAAGKNSWPLHLCLPVCEYGTSRRARKRTATERRRKEDDARSDEGSGVARGTGRTSARGVRGGMRAGSRPGPSPTRGEEEGRGQKAAGQKGGNRAPEEGELKKARGEEEGGG